MLGPELPHAYAERANRGRSDAPCDPRARTNIAESKLRQNVRIYDLGATLVESGFITLDEQSTALGLPRSTTWTIVSGNHKASGLSAAIIIRLLSAPHLPALVRIKLLTYVDEKLAGLYGHNRVQLIRFAAHFSSMGSITSLPSADYVRRRG
jgi:hypothetical protein